jgi:CheY-like chemotaxis protein
MDEDIRRSIAAGFSEHLTKPVSFQRLHQAIQRLMAGET